MMGRLQKRLLNRLRAVGIEEHKKVIIHAEKWHKKYRLAWDDHLARCGCHDSWDQCPCSEVGHKVTLAEGQSIHDCANKCCRWC